MTRLFIWFVIAVVVFSNEQLNAQHQPKRELRAAWIATVVNIDWPSQKTLTSIQQQDEYVKLLDVLKDAGMNAVVVQVRPAADAFYPSSFEPWSEYLTGVQGQSPAPYYNPLTFMIEEARKRGMEFHAWFNPYRVSMNDQYRFASGHPAYKHPQWFLKYAGKWYYDPGSHEAQEFVLQSIMETVKHYDLDAVHFDDYFYPYRVAGEIFPDSCSYQAHGAAYDSIDDWRRDNVNDFVKELAARIKSEKPHVKFGISPFGVWRNKDKDPDGSDTQAGQTNYDDLYADVIKWLREGWIDYVTPQLYWNIGFKVADYTVLLDWWSKHAYGKHLYIGQGVYRMGGKGWENPDELNNQIALNHNNPQVHGSMYFSAKIFLTNKDGINRKMKDLYPHPALIPAMDWIDAIPPQAPTIEGIRGSQGKGLEIKWKDTAPGDASYYVIYRFGKDESITLDNPAKIKAIVPRSPYTMQSWIDLATKKRTAYTYVVTAVDRLHNESTGSNDASIRTRGKRVRAKAL
jgi:uncharacterized lipoprotein YddW (UPF0748 family)